MFSVPVSFLVFVVGFFVGTLVGHKVAARRASHLLKGSRAAMVVALKRLERLSSKVDMDLYYLKKRRVQDYDRTGIHLQFGETNRVSRKRE